MASFPNFNSSTMFDQAWAPGGIGFQSAIKYYQDQLKQNGAGKGLPQLAASQASNAPAAQYARLPYQGGGTGQDELLGAYGVKAKGLSDARSAGRATAGQVGQADIAGGINVANDYGNSLVSHLEGVMAQNQAEAATAASGIGGALGLGEYGNMALGAIFDPANESGSFGNGQGPGAFLNPNKQGGIGGIGNGAANSVLNVFGIPAPAGGKGGVDNSGNSSTYPGFSAPSDSGSADNLASESGLQTYNSNDQMVPISGSDISQIGPSTGDESTGLLSYLKGLFGGIY